ncbi:PRMT5, partial [Symbiodinium sp. CCMP2592]
MARSESGSDPAGVDITNTGVHDSPFQPAFTDDEDVSVQSDFAAGMDISHQGPLSNDIEALLASQRRVSSADSSSQSDAEVPEPTPPIASADVNFTPPGIAYEARAARPEARTESRPKKTATNATRARGSVGRQARGDQVTTFPRTLQFRRPPSQQVKTQTPPAESPPFAWDSRLMHSSQHLETEHGIEKDAIGCAMSVKLVSWSGPLKITSFPADVVQRNAPILHDLYKAAGIHVPPQMEW